MQGSLELDVAFFLDVFPEIYVKTRAPTPAPTPHMYLYSIIPISVKNTYMLYVICYMLYVIRNTIYDTSNFKSEL